MNGILLIDKPAGWTSHDVVAKLRGLLKEKRIGHAGTLDPMATGLLVVFVGRATAAAGFAEADEKQYLATMRLGQVTDTQDTSGNILRRSDVQVSMAELDAVLPRFMGEQLQTPPMYSAIKVKGQKLVDVARRGGEIERNPRKIRILELRRTGEYNGEPLLYIHCSKGTYIRTLFHDIGEALGCGACLSSLRRVASGSFSIVDAYRMGEVNCEAAVGNVEDLLLPVDSLFEGFPVLHADPEQERRCRSGAAFAADAADGRYRLYGAHGKFLALAEVRDGTVKSVKNFFEVDRT
jgi:tRNA pseudouridine55 synthase